ncbi:TolC family protein [Helicobacter trogontum]|uniref:TolC family protein n=1 Tax=Helicobacter trogontum TaxID=50960 RepID=UPI002A9205F8|nr:TolC family protein [Helicobacter trogontum]MDY5185611.1 TolC family protein [Helicobacter trogontum]
MSNCKYVVGVLLILVLSSICYANKTPLKNDTHTKKYSIQSSYIAAQQANSKNIKNTSNQVSIYEAWQSVLHSNQGIKAQYLNTQNMEKLNLAAKLSYLPQIDLNALYLHLGNKVQIDLIHDRTQYNQALQDAQSLATQGGQIGQIGQIGGQLVSLLQLYGTPITLLEQDVVIGALNILYPLYTGGARYYGNKLAKIALRDSYQALRLKELATFEELVTIYYSVVLARETLSVLQSTEESALKHYENSKKLHKLGQIADIELLGAQVAYDKAKNQRKNAENALDIANFTLDSILQITESNPTSGLVVNPNMELKSLKYYIEATLKTYPALQIAHNKITMADYTKRLQLGQFTPKIGAFASFIVTDNRSKMEQMMPNWYAGVAAKWTLLSPQGRLQKYQGAKIMQMQASALEIEAVQKMELLVKTTYKQIELYKENYEALNSSIALAKENLRLKERAFSQGLVTSDLVVDARNTLDSVMVEQKSVAYKIIVTFAKLQALSGDLDTFFAKQK